MKTSLFLMTAVAGLFVTSAAFADKINFVIEKDNEGGELTGEKEIPEVNKTDNGTAKFTYDTVTHKFCGTIEFTPSTFAYTQAHVHTGDDKTANGPVLFDLAAAAGSGTIKVNTTIDDAADQTTLTTADTYVNIHSAADGDGAMRGQLIQDADSPEQACEGDEVDAGASSSSSSGTGTGASSSSSGSTATGDGGATSGGTSGVTPASTDDGGGCSTTGSSSGSTYAVLAGLGLAIAAASRKRKKA